MEWVNHGGACLLAGVVWGLLLAALPVASAAEAVRVMSFNVRVGGEPGNHFALEMDHMAECVLANKTPKTPGEEGLQDVKIITAIYEAAKSGEAVKVGW